MFCRNCGTEIAEKALVCYRCGQATSEPKVRPAVPASGRRWTRVVWLLAAVWLIGAVVVWNTVFDAHITRGARAYVDRQQACVDGRGPRVDMGLAMAAGASLSTTLAGYITDHAGVQAAFVFLDLAAIAGCAVIWFVLPETARGVRQIHARAVAARPV